MPNWSEGVLKVRGAKEDIENFIRNGIDYNDYSHKLENGELKTEPKPRECPIEIDEDEISVKNTMDLWVKGTRRMFVNSKDIYAYFSKSKDESKSVYTASEEAKNKAVELWNGRV